MRLVLLTFLSLVFILQSCYVTTEMRIKSELEKDPDKNFNYTQYGYVNGIRIDSIPARYGRYYISRRGIHFYYGQDFNLPSKSFQVFDSLGKAISFYINSPIEILNFFAFNGWELSQIYLSVSEDGKKTVSPNYLLRKRD